VVVVVVVVVEAVIVAVVAVVKYKSLEMYFLSTDNICDSLASQWGGYVCTNNTFLCEAEGCAVAERFPYFRGTYCFHLQALLFLP
jgi:hypothetical protein